MNPEAEALIAYVRVRWARCSDNLNSELFAMQAWYVFRIKQIDNRCTHA
jgi:hypothetical protein